MLGNALSDFWSYVVFVLVVIIFFVLFKIQQINTVENSITGLEDETDADIILLNYLRTPIETEILGEQVKTTLADVIIEHNTNKDFKTDDFKTIIDDQTKKIFDDHYNDLVWRVIVSDRNNPSTGSMVAAEGGPGYDNPEQTDLVREFSVSCTELPDPNDPSNPIKVELVLLNWDGSKSVASTRYDITTKLSC